LPYQALADAVLLFHFGVVLFVLLGLPAILIGNQLHWAWVNRLGWRLVHLVAIAVVALQAWLGQYCGLTILESSLRESAGQSAYDGSFVQHWVQRLIYYEAPMWVFIVAYTIFLALVAWAWWRYPPRGKARNRRG
jgi:hypothetical protein